ncbi:MAG: hypothetical protein U5J62_09105 [Desulfurivibrio sp.]|nr:hypothetical protein [Desulfurivibrio sp.]
MSGEETLQPQGEKLRRAVAWIAECRRDNPLKERRRLLEEAEIRFDLSPAECEFLNRHFQG